MKKILCVFGILLCFVLFSCKDKGFEEVQLSDNMKEQIAVDYNAYIIEETGQPTEYMGNFACQGKYHNVYFIVLFSGMFDVETEFATENGYVRIYGGFPIKAYLNHTFYDLEEAYQKGKVPEEALFALSDYTEKHQQYMDTWRYSYEENKLISKNA